MLHILNGDAAATVFAEAGIAGEPLVWRDILVEGPVPAPPNTPSLTRRAAYLADRLGIAADDYVRGVETQTARLSAARRQDEIVLWFEQDLFCTVTLWSLLDWLARHAPDTPLSLVYPVVDDEGRGLGARQPAQLGALFAARQPVTAQARALGAHAWAAYSSPDPRAGTTFVARETPALPFVDEAFRSHLGRFPSVANGLNEVEAATLDVLRAGRRRFDELFRALRSHPLVRRHGMGDVQFGACLRGLRPLVEEGEHGFDITGQGRAVMAADEDWLSIRPIDAWLGGVHLTPSGPLWRWDGAAGQLVAAETPLLPGYNS